MKRFDFKTIGQIPNALDRHEALDAELRRVGDDLLLTDCLMWREQGGSFVLKRLDEMANDGEHRTFKLRVLKDVWGDPVGPGDEVEWMFRQHTRDSHGRKLLRRDVNAARLRGEGRMYETWHRATVDKDCCITVGYKDAALLLSSYGVHFESGGPITGLREFASGTKWFTEDGRAIKTDDELEKYHKAGIKTVERLRHNWLYSEVPPNPPRKRGKAKANPTGGEE